MVYVTSIERIGREDGLKEGLKEGLREGLKQGQATVLLRQVERKFGAAAVAACRDRIEQADTDTLLAWSERILTAERVEAIFE